MFFTPGLQGWKLLLAKPDIANCMPFVNPVEYIISFCLHVSSCYLHHLPLNAYAKKKGERCNFSNSLMNVPLAFWAGCTHLCQKIWFLVLLSIVPVSLFRNLLQICIKFAWYIPNNTILFPKRYCNCNP